MRLVFLCRLICVIVVVMRFLGRSVVGGLRSCFHPNLSQSLPEVPSVGSNPVEHAQLYDPNEF